MLPAFRPSRNCRPQPFAHKCRSGSGLTFPPRHTVQIPVRFSACNRRPQPLEQTIVSAATGFARLHGRRQALRRVGGRGLPELKLEIAQDAWDAHTFARTFADMLGEPK